MKCVRTCLSASVRRHPVHTLYSTQYTSHESTGCIYYVYDILAMVAACIAALVGTWSVVIRVFMHHCAVGACVCHPPCALFDPVWCHESTGCIYYVYDICCCMYRCTSLDVHVRCDSLLRYYYIVVN